MDPQLQLRLTLIGGVLPGAVALVTLFLLWGWHAHRSNMRELESADAKVSDGPRFLLPLLLAAGLIACDLVINAGFQWWPTSATERYIHVFLLLGLLGFVEGLLRWPASFVLAARALVYAGIVWILASGYADGEILTKPDLIAWMILAGIAGSAITHHSDHALENTPAWSASLVMILLFGGLMPIMYALGWAVGSMMLIGVVAVLVNFGIIGFFFKRTRISRGGMSVIVGLMITLMIGAGIQNEPQRIPAIFMLALLPLVASVPGKALLRSLIVRSACVIILLATIGSMLAWQNSIDSQDQDSAEYDPYAEYE